MEITLACCLARERDFRWGSSVVAFYFSGIILADPCDNFSIAILAHKHDILWGFFMLLLLWPEINWSYKDDLFFFPSSFFLYFPCSVDLL